MRRFRTFTVSCVPTIVALNELWVFEQRPQFSKSAFWDSQKLCQSLTPRVHIDSFCFHNEQIHSEYCLFMKTELLKLYRNLGKFYRTKRNIDFQKQNKLLIRQKNGNYFIFWIQFYPQWEKASSYVITVDANESFCVVNAASAATAIQKRD